MNAASRTILVVDDEAPLRRVLERSLSRQGFRVIGAGSAETAYELDEVRTWLERHQCVVIRKPFNLREVTDWLTAVFRIGKERARGGAEA
jgi:ActR/RegA family two-component response regulator